MTDFGGYGSDIEQGNDFGTGDGTGNRGGRDGGGWVGDMMSMTTFGQLVGFLNEMGARTIRDGGPTGARGASIGDGYGNNSATSGSAEGASTGYNDDARGIENIINELLNRTNPTTPTPTEPARVPRGQTEGGRRPANGSMRRQQMPAYRGVSAGRNRQPIVDDSIAVGGGMGGDRNFYGRGPNGGSQYNPATGEESRDLVFPKGNSINNTDPRIAGTGEGRRNNRDAMLGIGSFLPQLMKAGEGNNALSALASFMPQANAAAASKVGGMTDYLSKLVSRGDIAEDSASINAVASPRLQKGRNTALDAIMMGNRVPDNLYDMTGMGAEIGSKQGAQNVNVRGRTTSRSRRY